MSANGVLAVEWCWIFLNAVEIKKGPQHIQLVWVVDCCEDCVSQGRLSTSQKLLSEKAVRSVRQYMAFIYQICHHISVRNIVWTFDQLDGCFSEAFWCLILSSPTSLVQSPTLLLLQPSLHRCGPICLVALLLDKALRMSQVTPNRGS